MVEIIACTSAYVDYDHIYMRRVTQILIFGDVNFNLIRLINIDMVKLQRKIKIRFMKWKMVCLSDVDSQNAKAYYGKLWRTEEYIY